MYVHVRRAKPLWPHASLLLADGLMISIREHMFVCSRHTQSDESLIAGVSLRRPAESKKDFERLSLLDREFLPAPCHQVSGTHLDVECLEQRSNNKTCTTTRRSRRSSSRIMVLPASHLQSGLFHGALALLGLLALQTGKAYHEKGASTGNTRCT